MSLLVVGSVALDSVETPFGKVDDALGGSASYFSAAARHFAPVQLVAVVGEDFHPEHLELLRSMNIGLEGLETAPGKTFRWGGVYHADLNTRDTLYTHLNVFADFHPKLTEEQKNAEYVFLANIHPELQGDVLEQAVNPRMTVLDTMNLWIDTSREALMRTLAGVGVVLLNDEEARMLSGESNLVQAARSVLRMGPKLVVVKKGEHGALVFGEDFIFSATAYPLDKVHDPTGAGDSFAGGFLGSLTRAEDPWDQDTIRRAVIDGTVLASFTVEDFSLDRLVTATAEEIGQRVAHLREVSRF